MTFNGAFTCGKCSQQFTIDLGPQWISERKAPEKIGMEIGAMAMMFARACAEHEMDCEGETPTT